MNPHQDMQHEGLSALLDGECQALELRRLLQSLESEPALRARLGSLAQSRAALQPETAPWAACDISARVRAVTAAEPLRVSAWGRFARPLASAAIAAGVATAVVLGAAWLPGSGVPEGPGNAVLAVHGPALAQNVSTAALAPQAPQAAVPVPAATVLAAADWELAAVPEGFAARGTDASGRVRHYGNGQAAFSVQVARVAAEAPESVIQHVDAAVYTRTLAVADGVLAVTVVGNVPLALARQLAMAVTLREGSHVH